MCMISGFEHVSLRNPTQRDYSNFRIDTYQYGTRKPMGLLVEVYDDLCQMNLQILIFP